MLVQIHESSTYKSRVDVMACSILLTQIRNLWYPTRNLSKVKKYALKIYNKYTFRKIWFKPFYSAFEEFDCFKFCNESHDQLCQMFSLDQLISFQSTNLCQTLLKLYLLRKINIDLFNDYLENLIDNYIIYLHLIKKQLFGHELPFQWSSKLMEAMRLAWS